MLKSPILDRFSIFLGGGKMTVGLNIRPKNRLFGFLLSCGTALEADLVAIWHRKPSTDAFSSIWDRFGWIWEGFGVTSGGFLC